MEKPYLQLEDINDLVEEFYGLDNKDLFMVSRKHETVQRRQIAMFLMKSIGHSPAEISRFYNMHHTTILHSIETVQDYISTRYKTYKKDVLELERLLKSVELDFTPELTMYSTFKQLDYAICGN